MLHFDKISTFHNKINNSLKTKKTDIVLPYNQQILDLTKIFYKLGYITTYNIINNKIYIYMKLHKGNLVLNLLYLISSPGRMLYCKTNKLNYYTQNNYNVIIATSKGLITLKEAIESNVGGFIIFKFK